MRIILSLFLIFLTPGLAQADFGPVAVTDLLPLAPDYLVLDAANTPATSVPVGVRVFVKGALLCPSLDALKQQATHISTRAELEAILAGGEDPQNLVCDQHWSGLVVVDGPSPITFIWHDAPDAGLPDPSIFQVFMIDEYGTALPGLMIYP